MRQPPHHTRHRQIKVSLTKQSQLHPVSSQHSHRAGSKSRYTQWRSGRGSARIPPTLDPIDVSLSEAFAESCSFYITSSTLVLIDCLRPVCPTPTSEADSMPFKTIRHFLPSCSRKIGRIFLKWKLLALHIQCLCFHPAKSHLRFLSIRFKIN